MYTSNVDKFLPLIMLNGSTLEYSLDYEIFFTNFTFT